MRKARSETTVKAPTEKKRKPVSYRFIRPTDGDGPRGMYELLHELLDTHHEEVARARFALAFHLAWEPDVDGRVTLGECKKVTDLEREVFELDGYDFIILINQTFWLDAQTTDQMRRALLDHELCHAAVKVDDDGDPVLDECNRVQYRYRKHDLEEFAIIAERYGCWKGDVERFAASLSRARGSTAWVGYSSVQSKLSAIGIFLPIEAIMGWTDVERRDAETFACVRRDSPLATPTPDHIRQALSIDAIGGDR